MLGCLFKIILKEGIYKWIIKKVSIEKCRDNWMNGV